MQSHWDSAHGVAGTVARLLLQYKTSNNEEKRTTAIRWERSSTCRGCLNLWKHGVWSLLLPQTTKLLSITDALWETAHSFLAKTCARWMKRDSDLRTSKLEQIMITLQPPSSPSLACAGWYRLPHLAEMLCLPKALLQTPASVGLGHQCGWYRLGQGSAVTWGNYHLLPKHRSVPSPKEGTSISLLNVSLLTKASLQTGSGEEPFQTNKKLSSGEDFVLIHFSYLD